MFKRIKQGWSQPAGESDDNVVIQVPDDTLGLNFLTDEHAEADVDIVAVHGLGGDAYSTWTASNGKLWLRDFLPDELQNATSNGPKKARIMTFGYDAGLFTRATTERSFAFAENLLNELRDARAGEPARSRPLIFIGHSLGGIVIKKVQNSSVT
ncbi:hypothetical protein NW768_008583 [Fusarium equiseti]|uniref:DUF676 domain-containing protein n=1 Tax=Fusarium equiseti TaxID=61235 RepID=A0ABQ8R4Y9_FUSEQ|nr:hypothetical protein NW768_008583 [Fusarium equiseti]